MRVWPLFTDSDLSSNAGFFDFFTLYANLRDEEATRIRIGTGLGFQMVQDKAKERTSWDALLWTLGYRKEKESLRYHFLWFLARVAREGEQVNRDFFPFITWDSAPERSRFSFLHRLFSYERAEGGSRCHLLFIPLWDSLTHQSPTQG